MIHQAVHWIIYCISSFSPAPSFSFSFSFSLPKVHTNPYSRTYPLHPPPFTSPPTFKTPIEQQYQPSQPSRPPSPLPSPSLSYLPSTIPSTIQLKVHDSAQRPLAAHSAPQSYPQKPSRTDSRGSDGRARHREGTGRGGCGRRRRGHCERDKC